MSRAVLPKLTACRLYLPIFGFPAFPPENNDYSFTRFARITEIQKTYPDFDPAICYITSVVPEPVFLTTRANKADRLIQNLHVTHCDPLHGRAAVLLTPRRATTISVGSVALHVTY